MKDLKMIADALHIQAPSVLFEHLSANTNDVRKNTLFLAFKGLSFDAREHLDEVVQKGATAIIYDNSDGFIVSDEFIKQYNIPIFGVQNLEHYEALIAGIFYDAPSKDIDLIGVTGTNGKSSVTYFASTLLTLLGKKTALMGTLGNGFYPNLTPSTNTTLRPLLIEQNIVKFKDEGAKAVAMEVSSHGLVLGRVDKLKFKHVAFTNLSRDHLDFHKTMANYAQAKFKLFTQVNDKSNAVINIEDEVGFNFALNLPSAIVYARSKVQYELLLQKAHEQNITANYKYLYAENINYLHDGFTMTAKSSFGSATIKTGLFGSFNVENLLCAIGILLNMGYSLNAIAEKATILRPLKGRMEQYISQNNHGTLIVDYAHTPDGLQRAIAALKEHGFGGITVICGCGGDRDTGKRPIMAQIASQMAHKVIFTNDNPRTEDPKQIIAMMLEGVKNSDNYQVVEDRAQAIETAYNASVKGDVIIVAGKGHEDYQIIGKVKHHYSDREVASLLTGDKHD